MVPFVKSRGAGFSTGRKIVARRRFIQGEEEGEEEGGRRKEEIRAWVFVTRRYFSRTSKRIDILCRSREKGNVPFVVSWLFSPGRTKTSVDPTRSRIERGREREGEKEKKRERVAKLCYAAEFIWRKWKFVAIVASRRSRYSSDAFRWIR